MSHPITSVISFCTNDFRYLYYCIEGVRPFSEKIIVVVSSHFFDGQEENQELLHRAYAEFPNCEFIEYKFDEQNLYGWNPPPKECVIERLHYWHSTSRYIGMCFVPKSSEYVFHIDVDEIIEPIRMQEWLDTYIYQNFDCLHFFSYRYQHLPSLRGERYMNTILLVKKEKFSLSHFFNRFERPGIFRDFSGKKISGVLGLDGLPMIHHYSWVRTKEEFIKKVRSWGHRFDHNWMQITEHQLFGFEKNIKIHPFCDPLKVDVKEIESQVYYRHFSKVNFPHLILVNPERIKIIAINALIEMDY
jgi:hypothetical protein